MRIALVALDSSPLSPTVQHAPSGAGAQTARVTSLAQVLARLGHRTTIYARRDSRALPDSAILAPGVTVEHLTAGPPAPLDPDDLAAHLPELGASLAQRWRRNAPDVAHAHAWTGGLAALAGARTLAVPVAQTFGLLGVAEQRRGRPQPASAARIRLEACIARSADVILASSAEEMTDLARLGVPRTRVRVVPCGVDTQRFSPEGPAAERNGRPRLLAAEPLGAPDGHDLVVRALAEIPGADLVITGGPDPGELSRNQACRHLRRLARKLGVHDRLVFTGRVAPDELPALLRSADLVVSSAVYEPLGMAALQAMACGTPVVTAAAGAERDAVIDATTGLLTPRQPRQLGWRIRRLLANPLQLEAYGIAAADRARSRYSWERIGRETLAAYGAGRRPQTPAAAAAAPDDDVPVRAPARPRRQARAGAPA
jgi:glycosyltransferase involved in cell wall biosynthesis